MRRACNCFVAGTAVETPAGLVPVEELEVDDVVLTVDQDAPTEVPKVGRVTRVFRNVAAAIVWLHLANGQVMGTTPGHEVWTLDDGWTYAAYLEAGDLFIGVDGDLVEIEQIDIDPTPTAVYNLEVDGTFTYFAEGVLVHNNSCTRVIKAFRKFTRRNFRHNLIAKTGFNPGKGFEAHHVYPHKFRREFKRMNIDVNDPRWGAWFEKGTHRRTARAINQEWTDFFRGGAMSSIT